jgi:hypothetical protein
MEEGTKNLSALWAAISFGLVMDPSVAMSPETMGPYSNSRYLITFSAVTRICEWHSRARERYSSL